MQDDLTIRTKDGEPWQRYDHTWSVDGDGKIKEQSYGAHEDYCFGINILVGSSYKHEKNAKLAAAPLLERRAAELLKRAKEYRGEV